MPRAKKPRAGKQPPKVIIGVEVPAGNRRKIRQVQRFLKAVALASTEAPPALGGEKSRLLPQARRGRR